MKISVETKKECPSINQFVNYIKSLNWKYDRPLQNIKNDPIAEVYLLDYFIHREIYVPINTSVKGWEIYIEDGIKTLSKHYSVSGLKIYEEICAMSNVLDTEGKSDE